MTSKNRLVAQGERLLKSVRDDWGRVKRREEELIRLEARLLPAVQYHEDRVEGGPPKDHTELWDRIADARTAYQDALVDYYDKRDAVCSTLDAMEDTLLADLLYRRYMTDKMPTWKEMAEEFKYSESWIKTLVSRATNIFAETHYKQD